MHNFSLIGSAVRELRYPHFPVSYKQRSWPLQTVIACAILWCYTEPLAPVTIWKWRDRNFLMFSSIFLWCPSRWEVQQQNNRVDTTRPRGESFTSSLTMTCNITILLISWQWTLSTALGLACVWYKKLSCRSEAARASCYWTFRQVIQEVIRNDTLK